MTDRHDERAAEIVERLIAEIAQALRDEAGEWRLLDDDAKNSGPILIARADALLSGEFYPAYSCEGYWQEDKEAFVFASGKAAGLHKPTHWQPLPAPPEDKT